MKKVMNYLRTLNHRLIVTAGVLVALMILSQYAQAQSFDLKSTENAGIVKFGEADSTGEAVCVYNPEPRPLTLAKEWEVLKCNDLNTPQKWHTCYMNRAQDAFTCTAPHEQGAET